jgi:polyribonucleotide nucleotidyltransferase
MGSVCGSTLALMDAGVPIKAPVAGVAIGLITGEEGRYRVLTDIQGLEDRLGDMDFKVAGTRTGITAIQLDIKLKGLPFSVLEEALDQAQEARAAILQKILEAIPTVRPALSPYAPRMIQFTIPVDKIGAVIGPGGKTIRSIIEQTKATIDVENDGTVVIGSPNEEALQRARSMVEALIQEVQVGAIYTGKVTRIVSFGAFVQILPAKEGLVRLSELSERPPVRVEDEVQVGDEITVMVTEMDRLGRINLSRRAVTEGLEAATARQALGGPPERGRPGGFRVGLGPGVPRPTPGPGGRTGTGPRFGPPPGPERRGGFGPGAPGAPPPRPSPRSGRPGEERRGGWPGGPPEPPRSP